MYKQDEMTTLHTAADCKTTAETAPDEQQTMAVAFQINNAANCGETSVEFLQTLRPNVQAQLESKGYSLRQSGGADPKSSVVISWK